MSSVPAAIVASQTGVAVDTLIAVGILVALGVLTVAYFAPSLVALRRGVPDRGSVIVLNALLGWTLVGWAVALALAFRSRTGRPSPPPAPAAGPTPAASTDAAVEAGSPPSSTARGDSRAGTDTT